MDPGASPSKPLEQLLTQPTPNFDYAALETETRTAVQQLTCEIKTLMRRNAQDIIDIGQKLIKVKQHLGHGNFINWIKFEFHWSVSAATKFMQVWEEFKFVNFTNLNITASALYLMAAPSTPKEARAEALERASIGENITYTKAKEIICRHKKTAKRKLDKPVTFDMCVKTTECEDSQSIEPLQYKASATFSAPEVLTEKEVETETPSLSFQDLMPSEEFRNKQGTTIINRYTDMPDYTIQTGASISNQGAISDEILDAVTTKFAIGIKNLMPEQLALVIRKAINNGLSDLHLEVIIAEAQLALNQR